MVPQEDVCTSVGFGCQRRSWPTRALSFTPWETHAVWTDMEGGGGKTRVSPAGAAHGRGLLVLESGKLREWRLALVPARHQESQKQPRRGLKLTSDYFMPGKDRVMFPYTILPMTHIVSSTTLSALLFNRRKGSCSGE